MRAGAGGSDTELSDLSKHIAINIDTPNTLTDALNVKMLFGVFRYASGNTARSLSDGIQAGWISTHF